MTIEINYLFAIPNMTQEVNGSETRVAGFTRANPNVCTIAMFI
jgi:hypothetical protein